MKLSIKGLLETSIDNLKLIIELVEKNNLTNEQWFLNALDDLNKLSVKY